MPLALFDLDDTLIDGDCAVLWSREMAELGWVEPETFLRKDRELMAEYASGRLAMEDYMAFSLEPLAGRSLQQVKEAVASFVERQVTGRIRSKARECVDTHRQRGDRLLAISASAHFLVEPIVALLGIHEALAIEVEVADGKLTGRSKGVLTYREGKVTRLREWLLRENLDLDGAHFYSDSRNDLPLLKQVPHPHPVNPDPHLRVHAEQQRWEILDWS